MMRNKTAWAAIFAVSLMSFGCTPEARQDLDQAGDKIGSATEKSAEGTAEAVGKAGEKVAEGTKEAARMTGEAVGGAAKSVEAGAEQIGAAATVTPKVKAALVADKAVDASTLNVTSDEKNKQVIIEGTQPSADKKSQVTAIANKALKEMGSDFTVNNKVTTP
jgi:hypothetical protein